MSDRTEVARGLSLLTKVKNRLSDPLNWCQETLHDGAGAHCILGAFREEMAPSEPLIVDGNVETDLECCPHNSWAFEAAKLLGFDRPEQVTSLNDSYGTTHEDIVNLLDTAISTIGAKIPAFEDAA